MKDWYLNLPISSYVDAIANQLNDNGRCVLTSATGTGKTIYLPYYLRQTVKGISKVYVSQPRVAQAESNAATAIEGSGQSQLIGHITGRGTSSNTNAQIVYMTEGILTSKLDKEDMSDVLVIIDEAHQLEFNTVVNLYKCMILGCKVLVTSATVQGSMFADYLSCSIIEATTTSHHVEGSPVFGKIDSTHDLRSVINTRLQEGYSFITICPGKGEIKEVVDMITTYTNKTANKVSVYVMHGELDNKERMAYLQHKEEDGQAVIVATNIGRTGLTYPSWIKAVVDLGVIRHLVNNKGVKDLTDFDVSKAEIIQAAGRIGRIALEEDSLPYKYTLIGSYDNRKDYPLRAIDLLDAREFVVNTIAQNIDNDKLITPYDQGLYNNILEELRNNNVIDESNRFTDKGKKIAPLLTMLEYSQALIVYYSIKLGIAKEAIKFLAIEAYTKFGTVVDKLADEDKVRSFFSNYTSTSYANIKLFNSIVKRINLKNRKSDLMDKLADKDTKDFSSVSKELEKINKALSKKSITFFMAEQQAIEGYRKLSHILARLGYKKDSVQVNETLVSTVIVAANGCPSHRVGYNNKVSPFSSSRDRYYTNATGVVTTIKKATFLENVTYFDQSILRSVFNLDPSLFTVSKEYRSDDGVKVNVYELGNCELSIRI